MHTVKKSRRILLSHKPLKERTPCGYCRLPFGRNALGERGFEVDHIKPKSREPDLDLEISNLTWACVRCNSQKSDHIDGKDPISQRIYQLFDPNQDGWNQHFSGHPDGKIHGMTAKGRTTGERLKFNAERLLLDLRSDLYAEKWWPA